MMRRSRDAFEGRRAFLRPRGRRSSRHPERRGGQSQICGASPYGGGSGAQGRCCPAWPTVSIDRRDGRVGRRILPALMVEDIPVRESRGKRRASTSSSPATALDPAPGRRDHRVGEGQDEHHWGASSNNGGGARKRKTPVPGTGTSSSSDMEHEGTGVEEVIVAEDKEHLHGGGTAGGYSDG
ncbi:hypothetical protein PVAP13_8KG097700 [Panicum virgatum]|uniref:Uncharacterized protein n=1 Tax=Panicum virgatum TaxID=38727 RepID=A0A8T0PEG9_PANVG|nr:hypothetical protein PVAP13_8KG097700 [Panicum virgatum]